MPTAADMAQLGSEIVAGHRTRKTEIAGVRATVRAEKKQTIKAMRDVHRANNAHKAETVHTLKAVNNEMTREFQGLDKARQAATREHAAQTGQMLGELRQMDKARRAATREHAKETRQFVGQLHRATGRRKAAVPRRKAAVARTMIGFQREDAARQEATREHAAQVRGQMSGYAAENRGAHNEWGRQMKASAAATNRASGRRSP